MYELTNPQKSIWLMEQYFQGTPINNICGHFIIKQETDLKLLNTALNCFIKNNDSFKLRFALKNGELFQYFIDDKNYNFEVLNIENENQIEVFAKKEVNTRLDILSSRPFDFKLFKLSSGFGGFIIHTHHIISDAATISILCTEVAQIYSKLLKNEEIAKKTYSYIDYIASEKEYLKSTRFEKDKTYWNSFLTPLPEVATFIPSKSESSDNYKAKRKGFVIDNKFFKKIKEYCLLTNTSVYNFLIGVYSIYLGRVNNLEEFTIRNTNFK